MLRDVQIYGRKDYTVKNTIQNISSLMMALEHRRITYVFGAGISSALVGKPIGWTNWLRAGLEAVQDHSLSATLKERLDASTSAEELVTLCGEIMQLCRKQGVYQAWMQESIESLTVQNQFLAQTLKQTAVTRDVLTTTNYDTLLEQSAGLDSVTYRQPEKILNMLQAGESSLVVHLHGMYSSALGIDDIVADKEQYRALYQDEGAQFIQNLFGTSTLIFIGCGQTMEDENISRLTRFMHDKLGIQEAYFYLKRSGEAAGSLPENIIVVDYGNDYDDLPLFLEEMIQYRIACFQKSTSFVGRTVFGARLAAEGTLGQYHYANETLAFVGRQPETEQFLCFLAAEPQIQWWTVAGQAGSGKSRLVFEWMKRNQAHWYSFFVHDRATAADAEKFAPSCNTLIAVDYIMGRETQVAAIISAILQKFQASPFRLRLLLIERESGVGLGSWYERMASAMGPANRALFEQMKFGPFLELGDLDDNAVSELIGEVCASHKLPPDRKRDERLREEYWSKFETLHYRPLFVQLFVEGWIDNGCQTQRYDSFNGILERVLLREQTRWMTLMGEDKRACSALIRLLVRAVAGDGLQINAIPERYREDWQLVRRQLGRDALPGRQRKETANALLADILQSLIPVDGVISPMYPDLIKEFLFLFYLDEDDCMEVAGELWENAGESFSTFMHRALSDFRSSELLIRIIEAAPDPYQNPSVLIARLALLERCGIIPGETHEKLLRRVKKEYTFWRAMPVEPAVGEDVRKTLLASLKFRGLSCAAAQFGAMYELESMLDCIREAVEVPLGQIEMVKIHFLDEQLNAASIAGEYELVEQIRRLRTLWVDFHPGNEGVSSLRGMIQLVNDNTQMMEYLMRGNLFEGYEVLKRMSDGLDPDSKEENRMFAQSCMALADFSFWQRKRKYLDRSVQMLERCVNRMPHFMPVRARYYGVLARLYHDQLRSGEKSPKHVREGLEALLRGLEQAEDWGEEVCSAWSVAALALLNVIEDIAEIQVLLRTTETKLETVSCDGSMLAQAWIMMQKGLHDLQKQIVSKAVVAQAHTYVMRYPDSENTRSAFFELLRVSEERDRVDLYQNRVTDHEMVQDAMFNPLYGGDAMEQLLQSRGLKKLDEEDLEDGKELYGLNLRSIFNGIEDNSPFVRECPKPGRNDPCPCGSGKKFKKCCIENGKYD